MVEFPKQSQQNIGGEGHLMVHPVCLIQIHLSNLKYSSKVFFSLRFIKLDDINIDDEGVRIKCNQKKFLVPFHRSRPDVCPASHMINYMDVMQKNLRNLRPHDR